MSAAIFPVHSNFNWIKQHQQQMHTRCTGVSYVGGQSSALLMAANTVCKSLLRVKASTCISDGCRHKQQCAVYQGVILYVSLLQSTMRKSMLCIRASVCVSDGCRHKQDHAVYQDIILCVSLLQAQYSTVCYVSGQQSACLMAADTSKTMLSIRAPICMSHSFEHK